MFKNKWYILTVLVGMIILLVPVAASAGYCFCGTDKSKLSSATIGSAVSSCGVLATEAECIQMQVDDDKLICSFFTDATDDGKQACLDKKTAYDADMNVKAEVSTGFTGVSSKFIPECLLKDDLSASCRDVSVFVYFGINIAKYLFTVIGALALVMFVYGGFMLILSQGSSDKVKKGTEIIVAAVIGLVIVFGAYMLVSFLGDAVGIKSSFKLTQ